MEEKQKYPWQGAFAIAAKIFDDIVPVCDHQIIVGSMRRKKEMVSDIEICVIPRYNEGMFEGTKGESLLEIKLASSKIVESYTINGPKQKRFISRYGSIPIDLFICTPENWAYKVVIHTGPADFSKALVTPRQHGGLMPSHLREKDCGYYDGAERLPIYNEMALFSAFGIKFITPEKRNNWQRNVQILHPTTK